MKENAHFVMKKIFAICCVFMMVGVPDVFAQNQSSVTQPNDPVIQRILPSAQKIGQASYNHFLIPVYDIHLYAPDAMMGENDTLALKLDYKLNLRGRDIAKRSVQEIKNLGYDNPERLKDWQDEMTRIFPDVTDKCSLVGVRLKNGHSQFYHNGHLVGVIKDPEFGRYFFDIWLSENTSAPNLRRQLLGNLSDKNNTVY